MNTRINPAAVAANLLSNAPKQIDADRNFSHGVGAAKTMVDEGRGAPTVALTIINNTSKQRVLVLGRNSLYARDEEFLNAVGGDTLITDGEVFEEAGEIIEVISDDADRTIDMFLRYAEKASLRIVGVNMASYTKDGLPDVGNFAVSLKTSWVSPFRKPVDNFLPLRKFNNNQSTSPQFADVNLVKEGFLTMISAEHSLMITVKPQTKLNLTFTIGAQDSRPQFAYRAFQAADRTLKPFRG
jgi:hypothetical protein